MDDATLDHSLLRRQIGDSRRRQSVKFLYGRREWVEDLDLVNELGAHTGCVNALRSGRLLASGSDDTHLNIWSYNPDSQAKPFTLSTSVSTGHTENIFSVKFMPQSNDRTVVSAAGDAQVRVFDIEYAGASGTTTADSSYLNSTRSRRFNSFFRGARFLNEANANARVYRSHGDRVKRIVTESSPYLFLTCSEDGEVRQWDLRLPSSAYPSGHGASRHRRLNHAEEEAAANVPPPLISYKKYALDLNSISCSSSQPQYIALGGAHLHCFLHDRRMLGRDLATETGQSVTTTPRVGSSLDTQMCEATRCVKRFAPNDRRKMGTRDNGHITACKISDANPNEMIASWSGDYIYSFDLVQSPDARDAEQAKDEKWRLSENKLRNKKDRKRKRAKAPGSSPSIPDTATGRRRLLRVGDDQQETGETALRVRYGNGQTEDMPLDRSGRQAQSDMEVGRNGLLSEAQKQGDRVAKALVRLRKTMFDFSQQHRDATEMENSPDLTPHTATFTSVLGQAATLLTQMDDVIRDWSYPMNPTPEDVTLQQTLRRNRQASWRFVQASGCLARTLGGRLQTLSGASDPRLELFSVVRPAPREARAIEDRPRFCYDFLKAILLWLGGGPPLVVENFKRPPELSSESQRFPLEDDDTDTVNNAIEKVLRYLLDLASGDKPIVDLDANRFELDDTRITFGNQKEAVNAFARAVNGAQFAEHWPSTKSEDASETTKQKMNRGAACRFWGVKVGRALLMDAAEGVNYEFVNNAFGGVRLHVANDLDQERSQEDIDPDEDEDTVEAVDVVTPTSRDEAAVEEALHLMLDPSPSHTAGDSATGNPDIEISVTAPSEPDTDLPDAAPAPEEDDGSDNEADSDSEPSSDSDSESDSHPAISFHPLFRRRAAFGRSRSRASVNASVPYSSHSRVYTGHCNTKTVKDVNFYGLNDEYVMSGSDSGHFFIWDKKTCERLNILEGDGEVVNVLTGHPYEPMIACSGIDSTVKIFGVGARERDDAENGINVANPPGGVRHSSLRFGGRRRRGAAVVDHDDDDEADNDAEAEDPARANGLRSRQAMHREYEITSQNDVERRGGAGDAYVTRSMLARLAAHMQQTQMGGGGGMGIAVGVPGADGGVIVIDDNCTVM